MLARLVQARDIIDHPSNRKPEDAEQAAAAATDEITGQPDERATVDPPEAVAAGKPEAQVDPGEQGAAALERPPSADLSTDVSTKGSIDTSTELSTVL